MLNRTYSYTILYFFNSYIGSIEFLNPKFDTSQEKSAFLNFFGVHIRSIMEHLIFTHRAYRVVLITN